jgi:hypothetical protein
MNNSQKTITSALDELEAEFGISETDLRAVVRKRMADMKAGMRLRNSKEFHRFQM